ncbi:MAG: OmpA family protein [Bacteroidales bacterium]|nr:OmpA family protein [Bacteroidales bacterium]MCF8455712.1 OmpA family protein [Bacteroidales bacterium]
MKKTLHFFTFLSLILGLLFMSCGPSKKLLVSEGKVNELQKDSANLHDQLIECEGLLTTRNKEKASLLNEKASLESETASLQNKNAAVTNDLNDLSVKSKMTIAEQEERLNNLQQMIQSQKDVMYKLKNSIADALLNYQTDELSVYTKDGNVYVSLQEKLLFKSGSDVVNPQGKKALKSLAQVLNNTKDITVMVEGHTDNVPIKTNLFKDNWDLSTARATSILRVLTTDNAFDPKRITASGRGEFHPVSTNETVEGRSGNRRTEIILSPNLSELFNLLDQ